jgi:hypothetical protein
VGPASEGGIEGDDERCVSCMRFTFLLRVGQSTAAAVEAEQASAALCCSAAAGAAAAGIERSDHSRTALYGVQLYGWLYGVLLSTQECSTG